MVLLRESEKLYKMDSQFKLFLNPESNKKD